MYKIMTIAQQPEQLVTLELFAAQKGYEIVSLTNAFQAIDRLSEEKFDLVILDLNLPNDMAFDVLDFIKTSALQANLRTIAIDKDCEEKKGQKAIRKGFDDVVSLPSESDSLLLIVEKNLSMIKKTNILVVDDNKMNAELMKESCTQIGYNVECVYLGKDVIPILEKKKFDLILLDIMMPEVSGYDVIKLLKEKKHLKDIPVIFVSALNDTKNIVKGLELGSYDYITKPFNIDELQAKVKTTIKIKELQDKLKEKNDVLDKIYNYCTDGIVTVDNEFKIRTCSSIFCEWLDKSEEFLKGKVFCEVVECPHYGTSLCENQKLIKNEISFYDIELKDKQKILSVKGSLFKNAKDEKEGYILILRDVTKLREAEKQKETFIATLTHDLKTPVRAEIRAMELLLQNRFGEMTPPQREIISEILHSSKFMFSMVDSLLVKYKYDNSAVQLQKELINVNDLVKSCCSELRIIADEKNQKIENIFEQDNLMAEIDPVEFKRVITNIILNAVKSSPNDSMVLVRTNSEDENVKIQIIDNGAGISKEKLPFIFDKYVTYHDKFRGVGTGLGLYISKKIIEEHQGKIEVQSQEGLGTTFTLFTPMSSKVAV